MQLAQRKAIVLAVVVLIVFLLASSVAKNRYQFPLAGKLVSTILSPVEYAIAQTGYRIRGAVKFAGDIMTVHQRNQTLAAENERLRLANLELTEAMAENARLRTLLEYKKEVPQLTFAVAAVIARSPSSWSSTLVINKGSADGIAKDMPVVTAQGLVGNVAQVFPHSSHVQLMIDARSAVGALVQRPESRVAGIVEGNGARPLSPCLINLARDADIIKGDKVITSGFGGIYPKNIMIGEVVEVVNEEGGLLKYAVLKPAVDFDRLEEVLVIVRSQIMTQPSGTPLQPPAKGAAR